MIWNFLQTNAAALQAISELAMAVITFGAVLYAIKQVNEAKKAVDEAKKARILTAFLETERRVNYANAAEDRRYLYEHNFESPSTITIKEREIIERICTSFDTLGVLVREDIFHRPLVFKLFYDVIIKCWLQALDFIEFERSPNRKARTYMQDFEYLYKQAEKYRLEHNFPPVIIHPPHTDNAPIVPSPKKRTPLRGHARTTKSKGD